MTSRVRWTGSLAGALLTLAGDASAGPVGDRIRQLGGCAAVDFFALHDQVRGLNPQPFGKPLLQWTRDDLLDVRETIARCDAGVGGWDTKSEDERHWLRDNANRSLKTITLRIDAARKVVADREQELAATAARQAEAREREEANRVAAQRRAEQQLTAMRRATDLVDVMGQLAERAPALPAQDAFAQIDDLLRRAAQARSEFGNDPVAGRLSDASAQLQTVRASIEQAGPYTDLETLVRELVFSSANPLLQEKFRSSLKRGFDLRALPNSVFQRGADYLIELALVPSPRNETNGFFCRVGGRGQASMEVLGQVRPPFTPIRVTGPLHEFAFDQSRQVLRIVIGPCSIQLAK